MYHFYEEVILPVLRYQNAKCIVEVGSGEGYHTKKLLQYCQEEGAKLIVVDSAPRFDIEEYRNLYKGYLEIHKGLSLSVIPQLGNFDLILLDGDHNWYTLYHELLEIDKIFKEKKFPIVFFHDIGWPFARRDRYDNPQNIPQAYCQAYRRAGVVPGQIELSESDGFDKSSYYAIYENNIQNGVMTAIEDFIKITTHAIEFKSIDYYFGLGCMYNADDKALEQLINWVFNSSELIKKIEMERIDNELKIQKIEKHIKKINNKNIINENIINENKELKDRIARQEKQIAELKEKIKQIQNIANKFENSLRYKVGTLIYESRRSLVSMIKIPYRIFRLYKNSKILLDDAGVKSLEQKSVSNSGEIAQKAITPVKVGVDLPIVYNQKVTTLFNDTDLVDSVSVVVCVHNALSDVIECLVALWANRSYPYEIILIDDGSDNETKKYLEQYSELTGCQLFRNQNALGYTKSANIGLKKAKSNYVILLNSDTIVTDSWLEKMLECFRKNPLTGIVSPLSNAASYQSVPEIRDPQTGDWMINRLSDGINVEMMALIVNLASKRRYPIVKALNGFCYMIKRDVLLKNGYLDEVNFPKGYGEEVDYCIRTELAGFEMRVVDDAYVFHKKSKSFSHNVRRELGAAAKPVLVRLHGEKVYKAIYTSMKDCNELKQIRNEIKEKELYVKKIIAAFSGKKLAFYLTAKGGSGGANSVCQEVYGLRKLGIEAYVLNEQKYKDSFIQNYPWAKEFTIYYDGEDKEYNDLINKTKNMDVIIGTIFTTIKKLKHIISLNNSIIPAYYIQDYEPWFFGDGDKYKKEAYESYSLINNNHLFAKTEYLVKLLKEKHGLNADKVEPSIDTAIYNPYLLIKKGSKEKIHLVAMLRPQTPRRNPQGTLMVFSRLFKIYSSKIEINFFGCQDEELMQFKDLLNFKYVNHGILKSWEVASLISKSDIFLDMSTYQAFGRTGLEAMCLGCVPVLPRTGGVSQYAIDNVNAIIVDSKNVELVVRKISELINDRNLLTKMYMNGLQTAKQYSINNAVWSEIKVFEKILKNK